MRTPSVTCLALDVGTVTAKLALNSVSEPAISSLTRGGSWSARVSAALADGGLTPPADGICLAVPEAWLDGGVEGTARQEALRHACEDELGMTRMTWTGQLAAVAALAAQRHGSGRYLVADVGATGVRAAVIEVAVPVIRIVAAKGADGGGWRDFDAAVRARHPDGEHLPADWYRLIADPDRDRRARTALSQAVSSPRYREAPVTEEGDPHELLAGQLIDCFAPTEQQIRAMAAQVLQGSTADVAVLTGGFGWFPLGQTILGDVAGADPAVMPSDAAARGALLFALGTVQLAPPSSLATVAMPTYRIAGGVLQEASLTLPWTEPFARPADGPVLVDDRELTIDIAGQRVTAEVPGLTAGPCRVGVRAGWSGRSALVVRPADGPGAPVVVSLDALPTADG